MPEIAERQGLKPELAAKWMVEPSAPQVLLLACLVCIVFLTAVNLMANFPSLVDNFGDSSAYMTIASAIRHWKFQGVVVKQFWGLPYLMAAISILTRISDDELERRWSVIRREMRARKIDALIMQSTNDWVGGYPYEYASIKDITDFYRRDGFEPVKVRENSSFGCHQLVFKRVW